MADKAFRLRWLIVVVALAGCTPRTLSLGPTVPTLVQVGDAPRAVVTLTDLDEVRDVGRGAEHVFVATDGGLLVYPAGDEPTLVRLTEADGLPSDDVHAVSTDGATGALVATHRGLARIEASGTDARVLERAPALPPVGDVLDLARTRRGTVWACGVHGLARLGEGGWERFGEPARCLRVVVTPEDHLWVGTTEGAWQVVDDVVREHAPDGGIPGPYVRDLAPLEDGQVLALVQGAGGARLGHWDGERWYGYTVPEFDRAPVGLAARGDDVLMLTPDHAFAIAREVQDAPVEGVPLTMLTRSDRYGSRSYRARVTPAAEVAPPGEAPSRDEVLERPQPLARLPVGHEEPEEPRFRIRPIGSVAEQAYRVRRAGNAVYVADRNRGVVELPVSGGTGRRLRAHGLVAEEDLRLAPDATGATWLVTDRGDVGVFRDGTVERTAAPEGTLPQTVASGPDGAYVVALVEGAENTVRVYRVGPSGFSEVLERGLPLEGQLVDVSFAALDEQERTWIGLRVRTDDGQTRPMGAAVLDPRSETVIHHHRGAPHDETGLRMPDEVTSVDLREPGMAWLASLSGAIRVGNHQAVVFGEARGVAGELVTDLAVGRGRVWIAAAEGLGYYQNGSLEFGLAGYRDLRPRALAIDERGRVWGAGPKGAIWWDGTDWHRLTREQGLPTEALVDVETGAGDRVWFLARDRVLLFTPPPPGTVADTAP